MFQRLLFLTLALSVACGDDSNSNKSNNSNDNNPNNPSSNNNNPQPPLSTRNAKATVEITDDAFDQPLTFSTALPLGTYNSRNDNGYMLNLTFVTVSEEPEIQISLVFYDPEKPVDPGEYGVVQFPDLNGLDVFGSLSITGEGYYGGGKHQTGNATLTSVEDGIISGTKLVSGTFSVEGILDWSDGKEGQSDFKILTGTFTDVAVTILP